MPTEDEALYSNDPFLLTLKGQITVHFMDGTTLEGTVAAQDSLNIFLTIDGEPYMIPRAQIRYIKGSPEQQIERDSSHQAHLKTASAPMDAFETKPPETEDLVMPPGLETAPSKVSEFDFEDDDGGTFVIQPDMNEFTSGSSAPAAPATERDDQEDTGLTFVLEDTADLPGDIEQMLGDDEEDATVIIDDEADVSGELICTAGPHAGEVVPLGDKVITIGRSHDNDLPLSSDKEISRRHAIVMKEMGKFLVQDQNSLNGTFVNDERIEGARYLEDGDIILIGVTHLEYREK